MRSRQRRLASVSVCGGGVIIAPCPTTIPRVSSESTPTRLQQREQPGNGLIEPQSSIGTPITCAAPGSSASAAESPQERRQKYCRSISAAMLRAAALALGPLVFRITSRADNMAAALRNKPPPTLRFGGRGGRGATMVDSDDQQSAARAFQACAVPCALSCVRTRRAKRLRLGPSGCNRPWTISIKKQCRLLEARSPGHCRFRRRLWALALVSHGLLGRC